MRLICYYITINKQYVVRYSCHLINNKYKNEIKLKNFQPKIIFLRTKTYTLIMPINAEYPYPCRVSRLVPEVLRDVLSAYNLLKK